MPSKKARVVEVDPALLEEIPLLRSSMKIFKEYSKKAPTPSVHDIQLCRFGDYLKHFGFVLENHAGKGAAESGKNKSRSQVEINEEEAIPASAAWGIAEALKIEADQRSSVSDLVIPIAPEEGGQGFEQAAKTIVLPFERITRNQSSLQCLLKKARCLYTWLAANITITLESDSPGIPPPTANHSKGSGKQVNAKKGKQKSASAEPKKGQEAPAATPPPDPLLTTLETRVATPRAVAQLYQRMLECVGINSKVVEGHLKGPSAEEAVDWAWNIVQIDEKSYLVDIAYSSYSGPLRRGRGEAQEADAPSAKGKASLPSTVKKEEGLPKYVLPSGPITVPPSISLTKTPTLALCRRPVEDFYFFTNPRWFIHTHLPNNEEDTLCCNPPSRVAWDLTPRLTHSIYQFDISLCSHHRTQCFSVRSTPFYITFKNENPATTELCCVLFKCSLWDLPEDLQGIEPLPAEFVWHQRRESDNLECFTITVPDAGFYSAVIGARNIRHDPFSSHISDLSFTPIVEYQMKVNFVPLAAPTFPRQHLPPNLCRLVAPLSRNILAGSHQFIVSPSCSNIAAVALVRYIPPPSSPRGPSGIVELEDNINGEREVITFLPFSFEKIVYEAEVSLDPATTVEFWVLYGAPDKNGFTFQEKVAISEKEKIQPPIPSAPAPASKPKKVAKRAAAAIETKSPEELEKEKCLAEIAAGRGFLPFATGIQAKSLLTRDTGGIIQPQPSMESERTLILRRLAGITPELYEMVEERQRRHFRPVGGFYDQKRL